MFKITTSLFNNDISEMAAENSTSKNNYPSLKEDLKNEIAHLEYHLQPFKFAYIRLLNKPYENEVSLTGQNPPLKCCQPLEILIHFKKGLDL